MKFKKDLYLLDLAIVFAVGVLQAFAYPMDWQNSSTYNGTLLVTGIVYWMSQVFLHPFLKSKNYHWNVSQSAYRWSENVGYFLVTFAYWLAPFYFCFDFKMTESEGALSFVFLALGLIPFRYLIDNFLELNHELAVQRTSLSEDEDYFQAS